MLDRMAQVLTAAERVKSAELELDAARAALRGLLEPTAPVAPRVVSAAVGESVAARVRSVLESRRKAAFGELVEATAPASSWAVKSALKALREAKRVKLAEGMYRWVA